MDKILALLLSVITSFSAFFSALPRNPADIILVLITGIPSGELSINDDFLDTVADILDEQVASKMRWPKPQKQRMCYSRKEGVGEDANGLFAR